MQILQNVMRIQRIGCDKHGLLVGETNRTKGRRATVHILPLSTHSVSFLEVGDSVFQKIIVGKPAQAVVIVQDFSLIVVIVLSKVGPGGHSVQMHHKGFGTLPASSDNQGQNHHQAQGSHGHGHGPTHKSCILRCLHPLTFSASNVQSSSVDNCMSMFIRDKSQKARLKDIVASEGSLIHCLDEVIARFCNDLGIRSSDNCWFQLSTNGRKINLHLEFGLNHHAHGRVGRSRTGFQHQF
mmetsp:Transcript_18937/g.46983  ORF Transcript_18937/g.46983 Transcript_18937/m.46983 type:complete len:239 (-) Transcript_18937:1225-1941(-)